MEHNYSHILEILNEYDITLQDIEDYAVRTNKKNGKIFIKILTLIVTIAFISQYNSNTMIETIVVFPMAFGLMYIFFSIFMNIGQFMFRTSTNPYKSTDEKRCLFNLNRFYKQSEKNFIKFIKKVAEDKQKNI